MLFSFQDDDVIFILIKCTQLDDFLDLLVDKPLLNRKEIEFLKEICNPHCLFLWFLEHIDFDHCLITDWLISGDTNILEYLVL